MSEEGEASSFLSYIWLVPTATAAVLVFGAVETGGFALFPVYGNRIGYSEADAALLLTMIGLGNVMLADSARHHQRPHPRPAGSCWPSCAGDRARSACSPCPSLADNWSPHCRYAVRLGRRGRGALHDRPCASRIAADRQGSRLGQRRFRVLLRIRHADRAAGNRHRHGPLRSSPVSPMRWRFSLSPISSWWRCGWPRKPVTDLTFRARSLCVAPSFPRPGVNP